MVLPIGFFAPLPLPMMIPFMGIQSAVMAEQFGTLFQYGKRRISAMSNEEFNKLTPEILQIRMSEQLQKMVPQMEAQIQSMRPLVDIILREFGAYITEAGKTILEGVVKPVGEAIFPETDTPKSQDIADTSRKTSDVFATTPKSTSKIFPQTLPKSVTSPKKIPGYAGGPTTVPVNPIKQRFLDLLVRQEATLASIRAQQARSTNKARYQGAVNSIAQAINVTKKQLKRFP